ncbi:hypothetical protein Tco_0067422 [Tanacetum coccineum]
MPLFKTVGLLCNKFKGVKDKVMMVLAIRVMILGETMQEGRQGLLNAIIVKVKDTWLAAQTTIPNNVAFQTEDLDTYDSDCDDVSNAKAVLMANLSNNGLDVISELQTSNPDTEKSDTSPVRIEAPSELPKEIMLTVMNSTNVDGYFVNMEMQSNESCDKCFDLDVELLKKQNAYNALLKSYS